MLALFVSFLAVAAEPAPTSAVSAGGFVEAYYGFNLNQPANGITALRGFDARHNSTTLSLASVHVAVEEPVLRGRVALQAGPTARSYFAAEPEAPGGPGVAGIGAADLHVIREAWVGGQAPVGEGLRVDAGVFLSPVGYDAIAVHENRFWSLSNLGVGLPFYFTGLRAEQSLADGWTVGAGLFNGWNKVVDDNPGKTVMLNLGRSWDSEAVFQVLYLGGVEGAAGAPWRHLFDAWVDVPVGRVALIGGLNGGFELREGGTHHWQAGQVGVEVTLAERWTAGLRADVFQERGPDPLTQHVFWPTTRLGEGTVSIGWRPADGLLVRLEGRHDRAADEVFFAGDAALPSSASQSTVTLGVTGWFEGALQ